MMMMMVVMVMADSVWLQIRVESSGWCCFAFCPRNSTREATTNTLRVIWKEKLKPWDGSKEAGFKVRLWACSFRCFLLSRINKQMCGNKSGTQRKKRTLNPRVHALKSDKSKTLALSSLVFRWFYLVWNRESCSHYMRGLYFHD